MPSETPNVPSPDLSSLPVPPSATVYLPTPNTCITCGYTLLGLPTDGVCPECGTTVQATLAAIIAEEPFPLRISAGVTALLAAAYLLGLPTLFLVFAGLIANDELLLLGFTLWVPFAIAAWVSWVAGWWIVCSRARAGPVGRAWVPAVVRGACVAQAVAAVLLVGMLIVGGVTLARLELPRWVAQAVIVLGSATTFVLGSRRLAEIAAFVHAPLLERTARIVHYGVIIGVCVAAIAGLERGAMMLVAGVLWIILALVWVGLLHALSATLRSAADKKEAAPG
jgi:hypothetical protein